MPRATLDHLERQLGDLVAIHDRGRSLDDFSQYAHDPVGFIRDVLRETDPGLWSKQEEIARSVRDHPLTGVQGCNGSGKDHVAARLALWWTYARRGQVLVTGPTERQVKEIVMGEVSRAFVRAEDLPGELFQMALRLGREERAGILAFTSSDASRLTGFHAPRTLVILTEAQGIEDWAWEGLLACATGSEDRVLAVGNPLAPSGRFYAISRSENWN